MIVVPHFVVRTKEYIRAVVKVIYEVKKPEVQVSSIDTELPVKGKTNYDEFIASLPSELKETFEHYIKNCIKRAILYTGVSRIQRKYHLERQSHCCI